jgi:tetratricopeptide (TPR) repeat protein
VVALLIREIGGLERLLSQTSAKSADRPGLVRRLAESYVELEAAARNDMVRKRSPARAKKTLAAARRAAIAHYRSFVRSYPSHPKLDEVLYYLAYEHETAGDANNARKVYYELLQKAPASRFVPRAYLAFGELFFQEAAADRAKWELAAQAYRKVIEYPAPDNTLHGHARYKLAYVHWNLEQLPQALDQLKKTVDVAAAFPALPGAAALARSARRDAVSVYAASGSPERAFSFFAGLSGDAPGKTKKTLTLLDALGVAYLDIGRYREAIALYEQLARRDPGASACHYRAQIAGATQAVESGNKPAIHRQLAELLALRDSFSKSDAPAARKRQCTNRTVELIAETAIMWHLETVGSGGVRGTNDERTKELASDLYRKLLASFTAAQFAKLEFPRIVRKDWPTLPKLGYALADLEYSRGRWADCARAFDTVVAADPTGPEAADAAYASVVCHQKLYEARHANRSDRRGRGLTLETANATSGDWQRLAPRPLDEEQKRLLAAIERYLCWIEPPATDRAALDQRVEVKFARARTYYEAQHWEQAALGFREIALQHSDHDAGIHAAELGLEALNVLARAPRPSSQRRHH